MALRFTFRQLEYLVAVGDAGSIATAAGRINVSSPSISAAISQLEQELGVQIFARQHAQGLSLTPGGRRIYNEARQILFRAGALNDLAGDIKDKAGGPISVGCLITLAPLLSATIRRSFDTEYPDAQVSLHEAHQAQLLQMLGRAEIDVAITYDLDIPRDIAFVGLRELPPYVMLPADHPKAGLDQIALADIAAEPIVLLDLPLSRDYFLSAFAHQNIRPNIGERSTELAVVRSLVANGFGYGLVNTGLRMTSAPNGAPLVYLPLTGGHRPMVLGLATKQSAHVPRIIAAFQDHLNARLQAGSLPGLEPKG